MFSSVQSSPVQFRVVIAERERESRSGSSRVGYLFKDVLQGGAAGPQVYMNIFSIRGNPHFHFINGNTEQRVTVASCPGKKLTGNERGDSEVYMNMIR